MDPPTRPLARPIYEGLPWLYLLLGAAALVVSYLTPSFSLSLLLGLPGLVAVLAGTVLVLRRGGYRRMRAQYDHPDALAEAGRDDFPGAQ
jgi:Flp pilus assembly protein TadB